MAVIFTGGDLQAEVLYHPRNRDLYLNGQASTLICILPGTSILPVSVSFFQVPLMDLCKASRLIRAILG